jgi:ATP-dependent Clp protease ATP-binding subunit ClpC
LGNTIDFKNAILIMTSNIGARYIEKKGRVGFQSDDEQVTTARINEMVLGEVKKTFNPEFINRVDEIIIFDALSDDDLRKIVSLLVEQMNLNLRDKKLQISVMPDAVEWIITSTCGDRSYGARPLRRALQKHVEDPLSEAFIRGTLTPGRLVEIYPDGDKLALRQGDPVEEGQPLSV